MADITSYNSVNKMLGELKLLTRSSNTEKTYLKGLNSFIETMKIENLDILIDELKNSKKDPDEVYKEYVLKLANREVAPKTVGAWASSVKKLFAANGIDLKRNVSIKIYNMHEDVLPAKDDLKKILSECGVRTKTIILLLSSSGLRVGELRELKLSDVDMISNPVKITIKGATAKERKSRITFISKEAKDSLNSYLEKRKGKGENITPDSSLITTSGGVKMSYQNLQFILNNAFKKVSKKEGKRYKLHAHSLRKWFKTQMISAGVPGPIVDRLVGHSRYLASEYELYTEEQLKDWYMKGMENLGLL